MSVLGVFFGMCDSPQLVFDGPPVDCGCCQGCIRVRREADRSRRFYWARRSAKLRSVQIH